MNCKLVSDESELLLFINKTSYTTFAFNNLMCVFHSLRDTGTEFVEFSNLDRPIRFFFSFYYVHYGMFKA